MDLDCPLEYYEATAAGVGTIGTLIVPSSVECGADAVATDVCRTGSGLIGCLMVKASASYGIWIG